MNRGLNAVGDSATITLIVEARDLDTDERSCETFIVERPSSSSEERGQLAEAAAKLHPAAKMRSFAESAATFLDRQHLIVAFYADLPAEPRETEDDSGGGQEPLFA